MTDPVTTAQYIGFLETPQPNLEYLGFEYPQYELRPQTAHQDLEQIKATQYIMGKRMEEFFLYHVTHHSSEQVVAHNQQIRRGKETLGEVDFLLKDPQTGQVSHIELVYKFYLLDKSSGKSGASSWIGPNRRDSLSQKMARLRERQFPILFQEETQQLLADLSIAPGNVIQKVCFKAWFFLPADFPADKIPKEAEGAIGGFYIKFADFTFSRFGRCLFFSPRKPNWPIRVKENHNWVDFDQISKLVLSMHTRRQSPLIWMKTPEKKYYRFFITWW